MSNSPRIDGPHRAKIADAATKLAVKEGVTLTNTDSVTKVLRNVANAKGANLAHDAKEHDILAFLLTFYAGV